MGRLDLTGQKFGHLTVLGPADDIGGHPAWRCRCDCGNETVVRSNRETVVRTGHLREGRTKSCGCRDGGGRRRPATGSAETDST